MKVSEIVEKWDKGTASVSSEVRDYWLNKAFLGGEQWVYHNETANRVERYRADDDRVQATVNRIWPASRTIISKLTQRNLAFEVMPAEPDDATMRGAATAEAILHDTHLRHRWEHKRTINAWSTWLGGTAAICVDWDPSAGARIDGDTYTGDTVETTLSLAEFTIEPGSKDAETARWWIKAQALPPEQVKSTYKLSDLPPADAKAGLSNLTSSAADYSTESKSRRPDLTRVLTYYERPNPSNPKGSVAVVVDGKFAVTPKPWPFPFTDRLNLALTYETEDDARWVGSSVVTQARPLQVLLNLAESSISEHMKNAGNARMAVPQNMIDMMESFSDLPGEMLPMADMSQVPVWLSPPTMPDWWSRRPDELAAMIDDLLGWHDVSRGNAPVNVESGYGLSILAEHDSTPVGRMVKSEAEAWGRVATMVLELYAANVKERRTASVRAPGEVPETIQWSGADLQRQTLAVVPQDAIMPRSRAAMMALGEKLVQMGMVQDLETFSAIVELPDGKALLDRARPDVAKARRENGLLALGKPQVPADFDDHEVHITEHNVFRKSARYERMPYEQQALVDDHIQAHTTMAAELAGRSRAGAAIDPMLASVPQADARPTIPLEAMPPQSLDPMLPGADEVPLPEDELAMLAEQAANI